MSFDIRILWRLFFVHWVYNFLVVVSLDVMFDAVDEQRKILCLKWIYQSRIHIHMVDFPVLFSSLPVATQSKSSSKLWAVGIKWLAIQHLLHCKRIVVDFCYSIAVFLLNWYMTCMRCNIMKNIRNLVSCWDARVICQRISFFYFRKRL